MAEIADIMVDLFSDFTPKKTRIRVAEEIGALRWKPAKGPETRWRDMSVAHLRNCAALVERKPDKFRDQGFSSPERLQKLLTLYADYREKIENENLRS